MIQRLDQLIGPVEVGKYYLVPTVRAVWNNVLDDWPVIGPQHSDAQCFNFDHQHYHPDSRFLPERKRYSYGYWREVMASPIQSNTLVNKDGLPKPVWRRRKCRRLVNPALQTLIDEHVAEPKRSFACHYSQWAGKQSRHDARGWICPHRAVSLADHAAIDGVIICPLHFLRIDAATGIVLPDPAASSTRTSSMRGAA